MRTVAGPAGEGAVDGGGGFAGDPEEGYWVQLWGVGEGCGDQLQLVAM